MPSPTQSADQIHPDHPELSIGKTVTALFMDSRAVNARRFTAAQEELNFSLRFCHYRYDRGLTNDQRLVQPHAPELFDLQRQKVGEILQDPQFIECRPQNEGDDDPESAEDSKIALEYVLRDPLLGFPRAKRLAVTGMLAARSWLIAVDVVHGVGKYGKETMFRTLPRWRFHIAPGWQNMHDLTCPWVGEEADMRIGDIRAMAKSGWKNTDKVRPDGGQGTASPSTSSQSVPLGSSNAVNFTAKDPLLARQSETDTALILKWYFRFDHDSLIEVPREPRTIARELRFQACPLCDHATVPGTPYDAEKVEMCPNCGKAPFLEASEEQDVDYFEKFPDGRLVIVAPNSKDENGDPVVLYDDAWPYKMRSFPYAHYRCYEDPIEQEGQSDTSIHWWSILILNGLRRFGWEQMRRNVDLMVAIKDSFQDAQGRPWTFNDLHGQVAYTRDLAGMQGMRHIQGSGISPALIPFHQMMLAPFKGALGTEDLALTEPQSKDIPVGTVKQLARSGNIPIRQHREIIDEEDSIFFGCTLDLLVQCWGPQRAVDVLGQDGVYKLKMLKQTALASHKVIISASPKLSAIRAEEITNFRMWTQSMAEDPAAGILIAKLANIPMGLVREYLKNKAAQPVSPVAGPGAPAGAPAGMNGGNPPSANGALTGAQ